MPAKLARSGGANGDPSEDATGSSRGNADPGPTIIGPEQTRLAAEPPVTQHRHLSGYFKGAVPGISAEDSKYPLRKGPWK